MTDAIARLTAALQGSYRIERELGQGGMATVYLAHDLKHARQVAIKVLKPELVVTIGAERFVQEITTTAALQHPHILPLFDSGMADGAPFYVMPFIDGETLRAKLERETQLGITDAVRIASDVADALHYAHQRGVIHRDIKPENILLANGRPMVADFGIALALSAAAGGRMTETGLSLGTPHYMSPEQATAEKEISARSDQYSLGTVLFEMLAGQPPHVGGSAQQIIMKIIAEEAPDVRTLRKSVPANVATAVAMSLEKLPADRFESAKAFAEALANPAFIGTGAVGAVHATAKATAQATTQWRTIAAGLGVAALAFGGVATWALTRGSDAPRDIGLSPTAPMRMEDVYRNFAVAHDGSFIVYEAKIGAKSQLLYQSLVGPEVRAIAGSDDAFGTPRISPDDKRVAFGARGDVRVVPVAGGTPTVVAKASDMQGGGWLANGQLFFSDADGRTLRWVDPDAGPGRTLSVNYCIWPFMMGDGDRVLCGGGAEMAATVMSVTKDVRTKRFLQRSPVAGAAGVPLVLGANFRIVDDDYLVYMGLDGTLMATKLLHRDSLTVGKSVPVEPMVRRVSYSGAGQFDITATGALVYLPGTNAEAGRLIRWSGPGRAAPLPLEPAVYLRWSVSPDGRRLAAVVAGVQQEELRIYDLATGTSEAVEQGFYVGGMSWSPDGRSLVYRLQLAKTPDAEQLLLRQLDSPVPPRVLVAHDTPMKLQPSTWLNDDFLLLGAVGSVRAHVLHLGDASLRADTLPINAYFIAASPDKRWLVYQVEGVAGITLQPYPALDRRYLVDVQGSEAQWRSPSEIVYRGEAERQSFVRVTIDPGSSSPVGKPEVLFTDPRFADTPGWSFAIAPGGDIIYLQTTSENLGHYVRVVPNWVKKMKRAVDEANR
jgi:serine/threonine-protein kinase